MITDKLATVLASVTDKLEPWFTNLSKANQRRIMTCYLLLVQFALPFLYILACIYLKKCPKRVHITELFAEWKVFKIESYSDLEQWQKKNTKLHRALK